MASTWAGIGEHTGPYMFTHRNTIHMHTHEHMHTFFKRLIR